MHDYRDCYAALGVSPNDGWEAVRAQYKRLISQWHPDRFPTEVDQRKIAEERSKRITAAYQKLDTYRRDHGALPPIAPEAMPGVAQRPAWNAGTASHRAGARDRSETGGQAKTVSEGPKRGPGRRHRVAFALCALIAALYLAHQYLVNPRAPNDNQPGDGAHDPGMAPEAPALAESAGERGGITAGSTFGDVYAIQGIPTLTEGDTWHYGRSQVRFSRGQVVSWNEDPDYPLRIARNQPAQIQGGNFRVGSTKDEVRATQGTPVTETATVWDYGLSRVYFEHNRVVRWEESPMQALRVSR